MTAGGISPDQDTREVVEAAVEDAGLLLVEFSQVRTGRRILLRVFVDRPGRVTVGECARLSKSIDEVLENEDRIEGSWVIEVSSPGVGRLLESDADWKRVVGRRLRIELTEETFESNLDGYNGEVLSFSDGRLIPVTLVQRAVEVLID
jgi:ribosome maturation factor RimP